MMRLGIVGLGVISRFYLAALERSPDFTLAAVCDRDPAALAGHGVPGYRDHRELLAAGGLDAVVVTAPNDVHAIVCRDVLDAGLPVCVEKPLATTLDDGRDLADLAARRQVALFTAFHRRYNSNVLALRDEIGDASIESMTVRYLEQIEEHVGHDRWYLDAARCGGGCVADNGPNALDLVRLFLGPVALRDVRIDRDGTGVDRQAVLALGPVSKSVSATAGPEAAPGGATEGPTYNNGMQALRPHRQEPPQARLSSNGTSIQALRATVELDWSFPGEVKDVEVRLGDGSVLHADMLAGYREFKESLRHEYEGVLREFAQAVRSGAAWSDGGLAALSIVDEAYRRETHA